MTGATLRDMPRREHAHTLPQLVTLFWLSVDIRGEDECWLWTGYTENGYGRFSDGTRMRGAHELALEWYTGESKPAGLDTCHSCSNSICCNPKRHLRFGTRQSNVADMMAAGRHVAHNRVLSDEDVRTIRERAAAGASGKRLAVDYGMSQPWITEIIRGHKRPGAGGPIRTNHANTKEGTWRTPK